MIDTGILPWKGLAGDLPLSDNQQGYVGNDIEHQDDDLEQPHERVKNHVEGFTGNRKPFALGTVHQVRG